MFVYTLKLILALYAAGWCITLVWFAWAWRRLDR